MGRPERIARRDLRGAAAQAVLWFCLVGACGPPRPPVGSDAARPPVGTLHSPGEVASDFRIDHRITIRWDEHEQSFRAVLEKRGDVLTVVGLGPHGGRGFVLRQEGTTVSFESHLPEPLPFPPEHILMTIQRVWLAGLPGAPLPDGEHLGARDGEEIVERWEAGLLRSRRFRREDDTPPSEFAVTYESGIAPDASGATPSRVTVSDGWMGFQITLDAITRTAL